MTHDEAREILELAAAEPDGLDRLMAGDIPEAAALAGHLAGCDGCRDEFGRLRRAAGLIREVVSTIPAPALRARTLAYVAAVGRDRPAGTAGARTAATARRAPSWRPIAWVASLAAAVVISAVATGLLLGGRSAELSREQAAVAALANLTATELRVSAQADAQRVRLVSAVAGGPSGSLLFSPSSGELVVVAAGLTEPATGREYRCWLDAGGRRTTLGKMLFAGGISYWTGWADGLDRAGPGATFGVTLADVAGGSLAGTTVLSGQR